MKKVVIVALFLAVGVATAGPKNQPSDKSLVQVPAKLQEYYYGGLAPEKLAYAIDLWYDAALKGNKSQAARLDETIQNLMRADLDSTRRALSLFGRQMDEAQRAEIAVDSNCVLTGQFSADVDQAREIYSQGWTLYKVKNKLVDKIIAPTSLSHKYRLMSDYIEVLRREVGLPKLRFADVPNSTTDEPTPVAKDKKTENN